MKTIKIQTVIDRARLKGVSYADDYMQVDLMITGLGTEKEASRSDMMNPIGVTVNLLISRRQAGLATYVDMDLTDREFAERYGFGMFTVWCTRPDEYAKFLPDAVRKVESDFRKSRKIN